MMLSSCRFQVRAILPTRTEMDGKMAQKFCVSTVGVACFFGGSFPIIFCFDYIFCPRFPIELKLSGIESP